MSKITQRCFEATGRTAFICDFSPPRSGDPEAVQQANIEADFISVAYNPGRAVRASSALLAAAIKQRLAKEVAFTLATRDMNRLAVQSLLLGAQILGLENVIVVQGDPFSQRDLALVQPAPGYRPTQLIADIARMNQGIDFRDSNLRAPTDFCTGATVDLGRGIPPEAELARRKAEAGAEFLITQPIFDPEDAERFQEAYTRAAGEPLGVPIFYGLQVLEPDGVIFSTVPQAVRDELEGGRSGVEIAVELYRRFRDSGLHNIYLVPPIRRGGARNYAAAREVLAAARASGA
jgi:methionine synthase / methylenetetrahydrofolate reductase(NADPH)